MCPSGKKIELFGRPHNCQKNWITLGNQLPGHYLLDKDIIKNYKEMYPQVDLSEDKMEQNKKVMNDRYHMDQIYNNHIA